MQLGLPVQGGNTGAEAVGQMLPQSGVPGWQYSRSALKQLVEDDDEQ